MHCWCLLWLAHVQKHVPSHKGEATKLYQACLSIFMLFHAFSTLAQERPDGSPWARQAD